MTPRRIPLGATGPSAEIKPPPALSQEPSRRLLQSASQQAWVANLNFPADVPCEAGFAMARKLHPMLWL